MRGSATGERGTRRRKARRNEAMENTSLSDWLGTGHRLAPLRYVDPVDPIEDRRIDIELPKQGIEFASMLELLLDEVPEHIADRKHEIARKSSALGDSEGSIEILLCESVEESYHLRTNLVLVQADLV